MTFKGTVAIEVTAATVEHLASFNFSVDYRTFFVETDTKLTCGFNLVVQIVQTRTGESPLQVADEDAIIVSSVMELEHLSCGHKCLNVT